MRALRFLAGILVLLAALTASAAAAKPELRRGINITGWFRFPPSRDPAALSRYLSDPALAGLRRAGFDFVRLAVDPDVVAAPATLIAQIRRLQNHGLAVVVSPHPTVWRLESAPADRAALLAFWRRTASALRPLDPALTVPEVLNEPVFPGDATGWDALQRAVLAVIRAELPDNPVVVTGNDWGSVAGLLALAPLADRNLRYSFHLYDPAELTSLGAYRPEIDHAAMARLRFPVTEASACEADIAGVADTPTRLLMRFYCGQRWDVARVADRVAAAAGWAERNGVTLFAGEFGASVALNAPARLAWLRTVRAACEEHGIGWALWGYDDVMGFALPRPPPEKPHLDPGVLLALGLSPG